MFGTHHISGRKILTLLLIVGLLVFLPRFSGAQAIDDNTILATQILDRDIYAQQGQQIGEIDDLVVRRSGKIKKITMEVGGFLGIGDKLIAMSFTKQFAKKEGNIILDATEEQLQKKAEFDYFKQGLRPDYYYYRPRPYPHQYSPPPAYYPYSQRGAEPYEWAYSPSRFLASAIIGRDIINTKGVHIGEIEDLIINPRDREVEKIIISAEDIKAEDPRVAITYEPLGFTAYGLVYDITVQKLRNLPAYHYED